MVKIFLLTLLLTSLSIADSKLKTYLLVDNAYGSVTDSNGDGDKDTLTRTIINVDYMYLHNRDKVVASINYTGFNGYSYNNKYKTYIGDFDVINATNLYYSRLLTESLAFTVGIVNYKTPNFNNNTIYNSINGIGIYGLVDFELESCLLTYRNKKFDLTIGTISKDKYADTAFVLDTNEHVDVSDRTLKAFSGSNGYVAIANYKATRELSLSFNYYLYNEVLWDVESKTLNLAGLEVKYDRSDTVGDIMYGILSYSHTDGDSTEFKRLDGDLPISNKYYGKYTTSGYNLLLGYNYTIDSFYKKHSFMLGVEYKHCSDGYDSLSVGSPLSLNNGGAVGSTIRLFGIFTVNRDFLLNIMYANYLNGTGKVTMIHGIPLTTDIDDDTYGGVDAHVLSLGLIYKF